MGKTLPPSPSLDWLKKTAKERLRVLRETDPAAKLHQAQRTTANDYGFTSWRALKAHIDSIRPSGPDWAQVFAAARAGDLQIVRRAIEQGFDPNAIDGDGRTIHQIAKDKGFAAIEILVRDLHARDPRPAEVVTAIDAIRDAAGNGETDRLRQLLDRHPELIDGAGSGFERRTALHRAAARSQHAAIKLLLDRGANVAVRDFPDNATPLHVAAVLGDLETVKMLVEAGSDVIGEGDDYEVGVLGWATCFRQVREDVADYLLDHGARLNLWSAIALDRGDAVRAMIAHDRSLLTARMTRNQHRRTALHHAAAKNRPVMVRLLLELGADPNASDATGATPLTTASQESADPAIVTMLIDAGAQLDFLTAVNLERYDAAEAMLGQEPSRLGPEGRDTIALHLAVNKRSLVAIRWLIQHGVDVNAKRLMWGCNHTALHMTTESGAIEIAKILLEAGADPNLRDDKYSATALSWAEFFCREDFADLIRAHGGVK